MRPSTTATARCGSHFARLALPVELQRRRADDDRREGAVGLERRERLDGLAEALLVGEERAPRVAARSARRPTETARARRRARAATSAIGSPLDRARAADRRDAPRRARRAARSSVSAPAPSTATPCTREERVERLDDPRVDRQRAAARPRRRAACRTPRPIVGVPQHVEAQALAVERRCAAVSRAGGGSSPGQQRLDAAAARRRPGARRPRSASASAPARVSGASSTPVARRPSPSSSASGGVAGARRQHPPAAAVVARRVETWPTQRALDRRAARRRPRALARQVGEALEHVGDVDADPVVDRRPPLARVPVEAPPRDAAHDVDDVRVVGEARARRSARRRSPRRSSTFGAVGASSIGASR